MENQVLPAQLDLLASPESPHHQSPTHPAPARAAHQARPAQSDLLERLEPTLVPNSFFSFQNHTNFYLIL